ncbi:MAG: hypothetical protein EA415_09790 [Sphaerobacteraceae bacterium]|nr:MAG: hypothetical protein EA415_09790 [Sphaerobacteraceae bacterium]
MTSSISSDRVSLVTLRASLHALLPIDQVDAITAGLPEQVDDDALANVIRSSRARLLRSSLQRWWSPGETDAREFPESLRSHPANDTLLLALHVGCNLTAERLAPITSQTTESILQQLATARHTFTESADHCTEHDSALLAGYRDGSTDRAVVASINRQIAECEACQHELDACVALDDTLARHIDILAGQEDVRRGGTALVGRSLYGFVPIALVVVAISAVVLASAGLVSALSSPAASPLLSQVSSDEPEDHGRIIYGTWDGGMIAFDPVSGSREVVRPEYYTAHLHDGANYLISPGGDRVAIFAQGEVPGLHWATRHVTIAGIDGEPINELEWHDSPDAGWPTGWLTDEELLSVAIPTYQTGESNEQFLERLENDSQLNATNVLTGEQRTVYQGPVAQVIPSPDGSRLAIVRPRDPVEPGPSVELWSVEDGVAIEMLGSLDDTFTWTGRLLWRDDSEAVYLAEITSYEDDRDETSRDSAFRGEIEEIAISQLDRNGNLETVVEPGHGYAAQISGFHDAYNDLIYTQILLEDPDSDYRFYRQDLSTGQSSEIELPQDDMQFRPTMAGTLGYQAGFAASPIDRSFLLHLGNNHYLPSDMSYHAQETPGTIHLSWVDDALDLRVSTMMSDRWRLTPLRWMSPDEVAEMLPDTPPIDYAEPGQMETVDELRPYAQLGPDSALSPDGAALPMVEQNDDELRPYLWFPLVETGRWVATGTVEQTWHTGGHAMYGVTSVGPSDDKASRLSQLSASQRGGASVDGFFDPYGVADDLHIRYAAPSASPDALTTSYFTVDTETGSVSLWAYPADDEPIEVSSFEVPDERIDEFAPFSQWIDNSTLIFLEPAEWNRSVPGQSILHRTTFSDDGIEVEEILNLIPRGRERGIEMIDLAIQPGGEYVAWRARHYSSRNDLDDAIDSISIARATDLSDPLEIDRSSPSTGLDWAPDGGALAVGIGERVGVYDMANHRLQAVSGNRTPAKYPVWLSDSELWFNIGEDDDATVYRIRYPE